jgi:hypothetical protein
MLLNTFERTAADVLAELQALREGLEVRTDTVAARTARITCGTMSTNHKDQHFEGPSRNRQNLVYL